MEYSWGEQLKPSCLWTRELPSTHSCSLHSCKTHISVATGSTVEHVRPQAVHVSKNVSLGSIKAELSKECWWLDKGHHSLEICENRLSVLQMESFPLLPAEGTYDSQLTYVCGCNIKAHAGFQVPTILIPLYSSYISKPTGQQPGPSHLPGFSSPFLNSLA